MKREVKIKGCDMGSLRKGYPATVFIDGRVYSTGAVVSSLVAGGVVIIETENTIYTNQ